MEAKDVIAKVMTRFHQLTFDASKGKVAGTVSGMPVVKLTTVGRKSGQRRSTMLTSPLIEGDNVVLVASYGGADHNPAWFGNLAANPDVEIVMNGFPDMSIGPELVKSLAETLEIAVPVIGAFAATGGETAAALLSRFGVRGIRLAEEIETGVALGLTIGSFSVPVCTKAGAFGDEHSLVRINERLRAVRTRGSFT